MGSGPRFVSSDKVRVTSGARVRGVARLRVTIKTPPSAGTDRGRSTRLFLVTAARMHCLGGWGCAHEAAGAGPAQTSGAGALVEPTGDNAEGPPHIPLTLRLL